LKSRYYNPDWGRFINADAIAGSIGELLGHNIFAYCKNNPINMKDDNGFRPAFVDEAEESQYKDWVQENRQVITTRNVEKPKLKVNKAQKPAQSIIVVAGTAIVFKKMTSVKTSDYVYGDEKTVKIAMLSGGFVGIEVATFAIGDFFDSTATKCFWDLRSSLMNICVEIK
jgi:hypothetical protein